MAEEEEGGGKYVFVNDNDEEKNTSRGYTGRAKASYPNGEVYDGYFTEGIREGRGKYYYKNGDKYEGDWKGNMKFGLGRLVYNLKGEY